MLNKNNINHTEAQNQHQYEPLRLSLKKATQKIAPLWPLENFVAVNPYLGLTNQTFEYTAQQLSRLAGIQSTLPISFYQDAIAQGKMTRDDIDEILKQKNLDSKITSKSFLKDLTVKSSGSPQTKIALVADTARQVTGVQWSEFMVNRVSNWAASYFDQGQAQWKAISTEQNLFESWKLEAETDRSTSVMGLSGFRKAIKDLPFNSMEAAQAAIDTMGIPLTSLDIYLHALLLKVGGWSSYIAQLDWETQLYKEKEKDLLSDFLCVLICWEYGIHQSINQSSFQEQWNKSKNEFLSVLSSHTIEKELQDKLILQGAFDLATQRKLINKFKKQKTENREKQSDLPRKTEPAVQAIFCIDVRSEIYRRNLETVAPEISTLGFAGFFGFPVQYVKMGQTKGSNHCPVLIPSAYTITESIPDKNHHDKALNKQKLNSLITASWKSFKSNAVASFGFVSPVGISYLPKLFSDSFGLSRPVPHPDKKGLSEKENASKAVNLEPNSLQNAGIPMNDQIQMAKGALQAMSLTDNFARLVLLVGHGSTSVNNPHASGLDCGACAGQSGETNARVAATILNNQSVRQALKEENILIPATTHFLACLHDTTTDEVAIFDVEGIGSSHQEDLKKLKTRLSSAGEKTRIERAFRLNLESSGKINSAMKARTRDWAQVRPEWGLAGCSAFVVAPRCHTKNINLAGESFLHSYEWKQDRGFKVLEAIMTAPMIVTSWINLQYFGSTVDNTHFGSGNKTLHNVTSGIGVLEGYAGDLRTGLPMQSIHDGEKYQHEPKRLSVVINAPKEAINNVLEKHSSVKQLCDNGWIFLMLMNDEGEISEKYAGKGEWQSLEKYKNADPPKESELVEEQIEF